MDNTLAFRLKDFIPIEGFFDYNWRNVLVLRRGKGAHTQYEEALKRTYILMGYNLITLGASAFLLVAGLEYLLRN